MFEFAVRALTVLLGLGFMICLPWAMFYPEQRPAYVVLVLVCFEGILFSIIYSAVWAQGNSQPMHWFASPLRLLFLAVGWLYLTLARRYYRRRH